MTALSPTSPHRRLPHHPGGVGAGGAFGFFGGDLARGLWLVL